MSEGQLTPNLGDQATPLLTRDGRTREQVELEKLDAERRKLLLETRVLEAPLWRRPAVWAALIPTVGALATLLAGWLSGYFGDLEVQAETHKALVETESRQLEMENAQLKAHKADLEARTGKLAQEEADTKVRIQEAEKREKDAEQAAFKAQLLADEAQNAAKCARLDTAFLVARSEGLAYASLPKRVDAKPLIEMASKELGWSGDELDQLKYAIEIEPNYRWKAVDANASRIGIALVEQQLASDLLKNFPEYLGVNVPDTEFHPTIFTGNQLLDDAAKFLTDDPAAKKAFDQERSMLSKEEKVALEQNLFLVIYPSVQRQVMDFKNNALRAQIPATAVKSLASELIRQWQAQDHVAGIIYKLQHHLESLCPKNPI